MASSAQALDENAFAIEMREAETGSIRWRTARAGFATLQLAARTRPPHLYSAVRGAEMVWAREAIRALPREHWAFHLLSPVVEAMARHHEAAPPSSPVASGLLAYAFLLKSSGDFALAAEAFRTLLATVREVEVDETILANARTELDQCVRWLDRERYTLDTGRDGPASDDRLLHTDAQTDATLARLRAELDRLQRYSDDGTRGVSLFTSKMDVELLAAEAAAVGAEDIRWGAVVVRAVLEYEDGISDSALLGVWRVVTEPAAGAANRDEALHILATWLTELGQYDEAQIAGEVLSDRGATAEARMRGILHRLDVAGLACREPAVERHARELQSQPLNDVAAAANMVAIGRAYAAVGRVADAVEVLTSAIPTATATAQPLIAFAAEELLRDVAAGMPVTGRPPRIATLEVVPGICDGLRALREVLATTPRPRRSGPHAQAPLTG